MNNQGNEVTEMWRDHKTSRADKRAKNRLESARRLVAQGIEYTSHNDGAHLVVEHNSLILDFWPGTGRWKNRKTGEYGFGVKLLLKKIGAKL